MSSASWGESSCTIRWRINKSRGSRDLNLCHRESRKLFVECEGWVWIHSAGPKLHLPVKKKKTNQKIWKKKLVDDAENTAVDADVSARYQADRPKSKSECLNATPLKTLTCANTTRHLQYLQCPRLVRRAVKLIKTSMWGSILCLSLTFRWCSTSSSDALTPSRAIWLWQPGFADSRFISIKCISKCWFARVDRCDCTHWILASKDGNTLIH